MDFRLAALQRWLGAHFRDAPFTLAPASEDASFRRYWRLSFADGRSFVAMDAPPEKEDCGPFLHVARVFAAAGVHVPRIHAQHLEGGFLLLEDLGKTTYLELFRDHDPEAPYAAATDALIRIQLASRPGVLPEYDRALLERELRLFPDWYLERELGRELGPKEAQALRGVFEALLANNLAQPRVFVHRDYHSRNLMACEPLPGILDFQDAVYGPVSYDLVSLFRDAYVHWEEAKVREQVDDLLLSEVAAAGRAVRRQAFAAERLLVALGVGTRGEEHDDLARLGLARVDELAYAARDPSRLSRTPVLRRPGEARLADVQLVRVLL